jgi:oxalate---CoA ligase
MTRDDDIGAAAASNPATFRDVLRFWADRTPDAPAFLTESGSGLPFSALLPLVDGIGAALNACGFGRGDRIAVVHPGGINLATATLGVWGHATVVPLSPKHRLGEYAVYLRDLRVDAVAIAKGMETPARAAAARLGLPVLDLVQPGEAETGHVLLEGPRIDRPHRTGRARPEDVAVALMTSGTTSESKVVPIQHAHICPRAEDSGRMLGYTRADRGASMMQLHHWGGFGAMTYTLFAGSSVAHFPGQDIGRIFRSLEDVRPTYLSAPYTVYHAILAQRERLDGSIEKIKPGLRMLRTGSGHLDLRVAVELEDIFGVPVIQAYGSSETAFMTCEPLPPKRRKPGSVGLPGSTRIAILDERNNRLPPDKVGAIAVMGPKIFEGYEDNPAANAEAFVDGWFRVGDLGYFDEDGYLFLTGRIKEVINRGGQKIAPAEIDAAIMAHPAVAAAAAFPVPHPTLGDDVAAAVVLEPGATLDQKTLTASLRAKLGEAKVPRQILFVDDIPRGTTGKIQRYKLAAAFGLDRPGSTRAAPETPIEKAATRMEATLQRIWAETLKLPAVPLDEDFFALGGDSLLAVELFLRIEETLGRRLPRTVLFESGTVAEMAAAIETDYRAACLVPIQPAGDKPIFFCIHGVDGDVLYFRDLARHLGNRQPFYGIRAQGLDGTVVPSTSVSGMAAQYIAEMRQVQPKGPYFIGGYSFGGWAAFETARQLREAGEEVALLAILDTHCPTGRPSLPLSARFFLARQHARSNGRVGAFSSSVGETVVNSVRLDAMSLASRLGVGKGRLEARFRRYPIEAHSVALRRYRPATYAGDATLFHTKPFEPGANSHYDGWRKLIRGRLTATPVTGSHFDMMYEPGVATLAQALADSITRAARKPS